MRQPPAVRVLATASAGAVAAIASLAGPALGVGSPALHVVLALAAAVALAAVERRLACRACDVLRRLLELLAAASPPPPPLRAAPVQVPSPRPLHLRGPPV
ncbi:MAG: hypothetical protein ACTHNU_02000 [Gaiellales bacterium]|jgi:hypothetical protein